MNLRNLIILFLVSILWVTGFQLVDHLFSDTPLRFDLVTLLLLPGLVFLVLLAYGFVTGDLLPSLAGRSPFWTGYRVRWVEYTMFWLMVLGYIDLSGVILGEETYGAVDLIITVVGSVVGGALLAWVAPEEKSIENGSTV